MRRHVLGLFTSATLATTSVAQAQEQLVVRELPGHVSELIATIDAPPAEVYAMATDYNAWAQNFTDVKAVQVKSGNRETAHVRFHSRALGQTVTVGFDNIPNRAIRFRGIEGPPGGRAQGAYLLFPVDGGRRTMVKAQLYLDVVGAAGMFISDSKIQRLRQAKLRGDIGDMIRHFPPGRAVIPPPANAIPPVRPAK